MRFDQKITLKNGKEAWLRNGDAADGAAVFACFNTAHAETDYLLSYPDENSFDPEQEALFLEKKTNSPDEIEIIALIDGTIAGTAGIGAVGNKYKVKLDGLNPAFFATPALALKSCYDLLVEAREAMEDDDS